MNQPPRDSQRKSSCMYLLLRDAVATSVVGFLLLGIHHFGRPFIRGFHCDDETIRYPHRESTVSSNVCYLTGSLLNILLILIFEYLHLTNSHTIANRNNEPSSTSNGFDTKEYIKNVYCRLVIWFFGAISSELLTDIAKVTAGRLRPHFISVCVPVINSNGKEMPLDEFCAEDKKKYLYITDYYCSGSNSRDIRLSFLSGHSSYSFYSAIHAVLYLQSRMDVVKFGLFKPASQVLITSAAFYTALTRVSDYKHHWQDVLAGVLLGSIVATVATRTLYFAFYKAHNKYFVRNGTGTRIAGDDAVGEELNRVSY